METANLADRPSVVVTQVVVAYKANRADGEMADRASRADVVKADRVELGDRAETNKAEGVVILYSDQFKWVIAIKALPIKTSHSMAIANTAGRHQWF